MRILEYRGNGEVGNDIAGRQRGERDHNEAELRDFDRRVRDLLDGESFRYVTELKMDGLSMAAHYRDGRFEQAVTRGDGLVGEDVTENARTIRSLPLRVKTKREAFEVRGETVMNRRAFVREIERPGINKTTQE